MMTATKATSKPIVPGMKVKVHVKSKALYGEVISLLANDILLLEGRPDFEHLPLSAFDLFRCINEVEFFKPPSL